MTGDPQIRAIDVVEINPLYLFRWEEPQQAYVLLYPEGIVKLNGTAGEILKLCTGDRTVAQVIDELEQKYPGEAVADSAHRFLEVSHAKGWVRVKP